MTVDQRAVLAIKVHLNKSFKNRNSENLCIANVIAGFSHRSPLRCGSRFESDNCYFYIVKKAYSPYWAQVTYILPTTSLFYDINHPFVVWYRPNWPKASSFHKKKIFSPFCDPYIKKRNTKFYFQDPCTKTII